MSGNQKQAPSGGPPQNQSRYPQTAYLQQRPPTPRTDGFHVGGGPPQQFVQQQPPNQAGNQGPGLRGMAPTGPPTQASTPPNTDLKVQHVQQQQPAMNLTFVQRGGQNFYRAPPPNQAPRMVNPRQGQQQLTYQTQAPFMMSPVTPVYFNIPQYPPTAYNGTQRPSIVSPTYQLLSGQIYPSYQTQSQQFRNHRSSPITGNCNSATNMIPLNINYYNQPMGMQRQAPPPQQVQTVPQNLPHAPPPNVSMAQVPPQNTINKPKSKRRNNAIPIINPDTGKEINNDEDDYSHPASGESSARQTPQPAPHNSSKEVQAIFAKQVAQVLNDEVHEEQEQAPPLEQHHIEPIPTHSTYHPQPPAVHNTNRNDLVQSSKLQPPIKDFVPANQSSTAKETPIVSAISNAVEVTIPTGNKQTKERESPAKGRKQRETSQKEVSKEAPAKEVYVAPVAVQQQLQQQQQIQQQTEKVVVVVKEEKPKEVTPPPPVAVVKEVVKEVPAPKDEKKNLKKEKNDSNKNAAAAAAVAAASTIVVPHVVTQEIVPEVVPVPTPTPPAQDAKSKQQSSQRGKDTTAPKQGGAANKAPVVPPTPVPIIPAVTPPPITTAASTAPVIVPQSQPAKPNNKSNKMKELNMKGATKEGTDMDAFNDNMDALNANDIIAETIPVVNANIITDVKKIETNDVPPPPTQTIKPPEPVVKAPAPRNKIDVCDIVREIPKPFVAPAPVENKDETDRAALSNDKLVQAKNEVNAKAANQNDETAEALSYKDDQWSPLNKDGKKVYDKDFLMALRNFPKSKLKPDNILNDIMAMDDKSRVGDVSRYAMSGRTDFAPAFGGSSNYSSGKSQSQRGVATKRGSQQGKVSGNSKGGKSGSVIRVSISFKEDVKLHETENAWKPARLNDCTTDEGKKTEELYRKVRGVLNKLTPQKFTTLISQIKTLPIDTSDRLQGVIDLVFEKAVDEPNFSVAYALMCRELALIQVPISAESKMEFVNFRKLLVTRCQMEFEKNSTEEGRRNEKLKEIEECADPEKKKELNIILDEDDRRIRMKSVGNIRFIGELFKQQMLTVNIMVRCLYNLVENRDEERLECLCKLLTTVGKELETKKVDLGRIFGVMKDIADDKKGKVSSRVRFMLQDVIDLRNGSWVPRRQDLNPRTIDQIQKEAENEHLNIQAMNSGPMTPRKDDRNSGSNADRNKRGGGGGNRNASNDDGWSTAPSRNKNVTFTVQSDKLKIKQPMADEPLGSSQLFGNWVRGSNIKTAQQMPPTNANMFAALEKVSDNMDNRSMNSRPNNKDPYSSKGHSMERSTYKQYDGRGSRSGSQHRSNDGPQHRSNEGSQRSTPTPIQQTQMKPPAPPAEPKIAPEKLERMIKNIIDEYINDCCSFEDTQNDIKNSLPPMMYEQFVEDAYNSILDRSRTARIKTGNLLAQLMKKETLQLDSYCNALVKVFSMAEDLIVDIPSLWDYYAELIYAPVSELVVPLNSLHKCTESIISMGCSHKLLASLFKVVIAEKGPNHLLSIWKSSNSSLNDWMAAEQVDSFISSNRFEFLVGSSAAPIGQSNLSFNQIHEKLTQFIQSETSFDDINKWINANVADRVKDKQFIRVLATVVIENSIVGNKLNADKLRHCYPFISVYVDNCSDLELQCLYAIQSIINKLDHPQGLLLKIFNTLYEDNTISHDSFICWEQSNDPAEQDKKGVAVKQLTSFFTQLRENDEESASSCSDDA